MYYLVKKKSLNFPVSLYDAFFQKEIDIAFKKWPNYPPPPQKNDLKMAQPSGPLKTIDLQCAIFIQVYDKIS